MWFLSHYTRARTNLVNAGNCTLLTDSLRKEDRRMHIEETENIERQIEEILFEQLDGWLLSYIAFANQYHIKHLWVSTSIALTTYSCKDRVSKKTIIDKLIELYTLKEIKRENLVNILTEL